MQINKQSMFVPSTYSTYLGHVVLSHLFHLPHSLHKEKVFRGIFLLQEAAEVIVTHGVLEHIPAAEGPTFDPSLGHLQSKQYTKLAYKSRTIVCNLPRERAEMEWEKANQGA